MSPIILIFCNGFPLSQYEPQSWIEVSAFELEFDQTWTINKTVSGVKNAVLARMDDTRVLLLF